MYIFMCTFLVQMTVFLIKEQVVTPESDLPAFLYLKHFKGEQSTLTECLLH